ncbi:MAG: FAD-dependent oxidoreductase [Bernardetiaceae bacterium]|nr:FAD-dependent oxidoreductase [Bernardetiaceae bacterium]
MVSNMQGNVIVIGAGAAGIYAAYLLKNQGFEVQILEASERWGGRIFSYDGFDTRSIELGAEFVHGKRTIFHQMAIDKGIAILKNLGKDYYWYKNEIIKSKKLEHNPDFINYWEFHDYHYNYRGEEIGVADYLHSFDIPADMWHIYEDFAAEYGTSLSRLGMQSLAIESNRWDAGEENYRLQNTTFSALLSDLHSRIADCIVYGADVRHISHTASGVQVVSKDCKMYVADRVVISVPLTILKSGIINFEPTLGERKQVAIRQIGMDKAGIKAFFKFDKPFWKRKMGFLIGAQIANEYWVSHYDPELQSNILCAFIMGEKAERLAKLGKKAGIEQLIAELDSMFDGEPSRRLTDFYWKDWGQDPFIQGAYSYPSPHSAKLRKALARPIENKIFFAGEATNFNGHFATVHGALETAERVTEEIYESFLRPV